MKTLIISIAVLFFSLSFASEPVITTLDNGLTVIIQEIHYAPVVASVIAYDVGSRNERSDILGISHFCEHLMFKGTPDMPLGRFWQIVQRDGGTANAFTSDDVTCYYIVLPVNRLDDALAIESDRMVNCLIDSAEVASERNVVHEERRSRTTDSPSGTLWETLAQTAYTEHPYMNPVIGFDENILAYDHIKAREYYETWYCPSNAVLTLVGDFDTDEVLEKVEAYFRDIPAGSPPVQTPIVEPLQTESRYVEVDHASNLPRFIMAFHVPNVLNVDSPLLDLIASYLSSGVSSRLQRVLIEPGLVSGVGAWNGGGIDPGLFTISITMEPFEEDGITQDEVISIIWDELNSIISDGIPEDDLFDLKVRQRASEIFAQASPTGLAMDLCLNQTMYDDAFLTDRNLVIIEAATPDDISEAAAKYFKPEGVTLAVLNPTGGYAAEGSSRQELPTDIEEPQEINYEGLEVTDDFLRIPEHSLFEGVISDTLDNGLQLFVMENHSFPTVSVVFATPIGSYRYGSEYAGLAGITSSTMLRGTDELPRADFHERLESKGSSIYFSAGAEHSTGSVNVLTEHLELAFISISDLLLNPAFRESDYDILMDDAETSLVSRSDRAWSIASDSMQIITAATPNDIRITTEETLQRITLPEVIDFYELACRPEGSVITVVGDVDAEEIFAMAADYFGDWESPPEPLPKAVYPEFTDAPGDTVIVSMPGKAQVVVLIRTESPADNSPEDVAFSVMNKILGSGIGSWLGHSVRDEQGLAYSVGSYSRSNDSSGTFTAYLSTFGDYVPQAVNSVMEEINRITNEDVRDIELRIVQSSMIGSHARSGSGYSGLAWGLTALVLDEKSFDYDIIHLSEVLELSPEDLRHAAEMYFGDDWFIAVAGGVNESVDLTAPEQ